MKTYTFYVYSKGTKANDLTLQEAITQYKTIDTMDYKALGITKDDMFSCDLLIGEKGTNRISNDYLQLDNFKNDSFVKAKIINILKKEIIHMLKKYTLAELEGMKTICESQTDDLKVEGNEYKIWLSRCTVRDGEPYDNKVTIECLIGDKWEQVEQYQAK